MSENIHILHNDLGTLKTFLPRLLIIDLSNLSQYEFKDTNLNFPNLETSHVFKQHTIDFS